MRRSIINQKSISYRWSIFLLLYAPIISIYTIFPPLLGILYILFIKKHNDGAYLFIITAYLLLYDINFSLIPFSSILSFFLLKHLLSKYFTKIVDCEKCLYVVYIASAYIGYFSIIYIISLVANLEYIPIKYLSILYYIGIESIISVFVINE